MVGARVGGVPPPVGRRLAYLVLEMADIDVLPTTFGVRTVEFKAGSDIGILNRLMAGAAWLRHRTGHPELERYASAVRSISWLGGRLGRDVGGAMFEITGRS